MSWSWSEWGVLCSVLLQILCGAMRGSFTSQALPSVLQEILAAFWNVWTRTTLSFLLVVPLRFYLAFHHNCCRWYSIVERRDEIFTSYKLNQIESCRSPVRLKKMLLYNSSFLFFFVTSQTNHRISSPAPFGRSWIFRSFHNFTVPSLYCTLFAYETKNHIISFFIYFLSF